MCFSGAVSGDVALLTAAPSDALVTARFVVHHARLKASHQYSTYLLQNQQAWAGMKNIIRLDSHAKDLDVFMLIVKICVTLQRLHQGGLEKQCLNIACKALTLRWLRQAGDHEFRDSKPRCTIAQNPPGAPLLLGRVRFVTSFRPMLSSTNLTTSKISSAIASAMAAKAADQCSLFFFALELNNLRMSLHFWKQ